MYIDLSPNFKSQARKAVYAIITFFISYLLLVLLGLTIASLLVYLAFLLVKSFKNFPAILIGIGLAASGGVIVVFLFKFLFQKSTSNTEGYIEIKRNQHPKLFHMIDELVTEIGTQQPKKVYLTDQLNASVFYDSSFWSMFFPVKKNLMIGYALVNSSTVEELKGILAHEFGHFSQKSMKVGSYVYNCNRIIYSLVYENDSFEQTIKKYGSKHVLINYTLLLSIYLMRGFQWVLKKMYDILNVSYSSLSREMEFHADAVATTIVGSQVMIDSLSRMDLADKANESTMDFVNDSYKKQKKLSNYYTLQKDVLTFFGEFNGLNFKNRYPQVSLSELDQYKKTRLNIKDQWASHPSMEERIANIKLLNIDSKSLDIQEANSLFTDEVAVEERLTNNLYVAVDNSNLKLIANENVFSEYKTFFDSITFDKMYNGYYNYKNPLVETDVVEFSPLTTSFETLFSDEIMNLLNTYYAVSNDYNDIKFIKEEKNAIKTFDFDGVKYKKKDAQQLLLTLEKEKNELDQKIQEHDVMIFNYFKQLAIEANEEINWKEHYSLYKNMDALYDFGFEKTQKFEEMLNSINQDISVEVARKEVNKIYDYEVSYKEYLHGVVSLPLYKEQIDNDWQEIIDNYLNHTTPYLLADQWDSDGLIILFEAIRVVPHIHSKLIFLAKKQLLDYQLSLLKVPA